MTELACAVCDRRRDGDHQLERPEMTSSGEPAAPGAGVPSIAPVAHVPEVLPASAVQARSWVSLLAALFLQWLVLGAVFVGLAYAVRR
jgi:hypothetical protein